MHFELENFVNNILSLGEISERSRELLIKKAEQLGVDVITFELELEVKIAEYKSKSTTPLKPSLRNNDEGIIKKCPACGAEADSFSTNCNDCGHEFRYSDNHEYSTSNLSARLIEIDSNYRAKIVEEKNKQQSLNWFNRFTESGKFQDHNIEKAIANQQATVISSWPVKNTKEDILEFLYLAVSETSSTKRNLWDKIDSKTDYKSTIHNAWKSKASQMISKAKQTFQNDTLLLKEVDSISNKIK
jgi:hypothetical protein